MKPKTDLQILFVCGKDEEFLRLFFLSFERSDSAFKFAEGAFSGLSSKAQVIVSKSTMSTKEFNKLKAKLVEAGFKGKITRK